jgi:hypothetical protein
MTKEDYSHANESYRPVDACGKSDIARLTKKPEGSSLRLRWVQVIESREKSASTDNQHRVDWYFNIDARRKLESRSPKTVVDKVRARFSLEGRKGDT